MKRVIVLAPVALAALAGCAPKPNQFQAGQWEVTTEIRALDVPGATPEQLRMLSQRAGQVGMKDTETRCYTDAEARSYLQDIRGTAPPTCRVSDEVYANGVMTSHVACAGENGQQGVEMSLNGRFTHTTFNAQVDMTVPNPLGAGGPMRRSVQLRARRIGECPAGAATPALPMPTPSPSPQATPPAPAPTPAPAPATGNSAR